MKKILFYIGIIMSFFIMPTVQADFTYTQGTMTANSVAVRINPKISSDANLLRDDVGSKIYLSVPEVFEILGEESGYYKARFQYNGFYYTAYINSQYSKKTTYTVKDQTMEELRELGFPETYIRNLAIMKTIHPNWTFKPYKTGLTWDEVIKGETKRIDINLISGSNTALRSTENGAYDGTKWTTFAGGGWYAASKQTVKYYMDPRNFLNDGHIFMFEQLSYVPEVHTKELVQSLINSTFMKGDTFECLAGVKTCTDDKTDNKRTVSYSEAFIQAAKTYNVSAAHLAARVIQEQGSGGSSLISGKGYNGEYVGYYNYFNVNANGSTTADVIKNGLAWAENKGWNSPYSSIVGGASLLGNGYIKAGQDTLYLQKFNVTIQTEDTYPLYTHQYMQNVRAPYTESYMVYKNYYNKNLINSSYSFSIPIFSGMPAETNLDINQNEDATLKSLKVTGCDLMPSFSPSAVEYTCNVLDSVKSVNVTAEATSTTASMTGVGEVNLTNNETIVNVIVNAASGSNSRTYKVIITKIPSDMLTPDEIISKLGINNKSGWIYGFALESKINDIIASIKSEFPSAQITTSLKDIVATGGTLTIKNNEVSKTYTFIVYGDVSGDGKIDLLDYLKVQKHLLGSSKLTNIYEEAGKVSKGSKIELLDFLKIQKHILKSSLIVQ